MNQKVTTGIEPRIPGVRMRAVPLDGGAHVIVIDIPKSHQRPHMVVFKNVSRFYSRTSSGKYQLDVGELRVAFSATSEITSRVRDFRLSRVSDLLAGSTPVALIRGPRLILHLVPYSAFEGGREIQFPKASDSAGALQPMYAPSGHASRPNFDGFMTYAPGSEGAWSYTQLFRTGIFEAVDAVSLGGVSGPMEGQTFEKSVLRQIKRFRQLVELVDVAPPFAWMLSLTGVADRAVTLGAFGRMLNQHHRIDRDLLLVPEVIELDGTADLTISQLGKRLLDPVWQSGGWEFSPNFDEGGNWTGNSGA